MYIFESKQVGTLYHTTSLASLVSYMVSRDILQASGMYEPNKITGKKDVIYFSRSRNLENIKWLTGSDVIATIVVDGDKLSENYHIFPYNDFADIENDKGRIPGFANDPITGKKRRVWMDRQHEECVDRPIRNVSKYIKEIIVRFNEDPGNRKPGEKRFSPKSDIIRNMTALKEYCSKHSIKLSADDYILQRFKDADKYQDPLKSKLKINDETLEAQDLILNNSVQAESTLTKLVGLIKNGADANRLYAMDNEPILIKLCSVRKESDLVLSVIKAIIDSGADINIRGWQDRTPLMWACENSLTKTVKLLLSSGADVNASTKYGDNALSLTEKATIKKLLVAAGAKQESLEIRVHRLERMLLD